MSSRWTYFSFHNVFLRLALLPLHNLPIPSPRGVCPVHILLYLSSRLIIQCFSSSCPLNIHIHLRHSRQSNYTSQCTWSYRWYNLRFSISSSSYFRLHLHQLFALLSSQSSRSWNKRSSRITLLRPMGFLVLHTSP